MGNVKRVIAVLLSGAVLFAPALHAGNDAAAAGAAQGRAAGAAASSTASTTPSGRGALYQVRHQGQVSWLYGTVHVGTPEFAPLGVEVERALKAARRLVLELDIRDDAPLQGALDKHGLYPRDAGIEQHIAPDTLARLQHVLPAYDMTLADVRRMKPWLTANFLLSLDLHRHGYRRQHGAETVLLAAAPDKAVLELETAEYQLSLFDTMSAAEQEEYLRDALTEIDNGRALNKSRALMQAWANGDRKEVERLWQDSLAEGTRMSTFTHRVLLDGRNPEMARRLEELLKDGESSFVGVGLLHLIGETGLPALLRQRGYQVERVY